MRQRHSPGQPIGSAGHKEDQQGKRKNKAAQHLAVQVQKRRCRQSKCDQEDTPRQKSTELTEQKNPAAADPVRHTSEDWRTKKLKKRIGCGEDPINDRIPTPSRNKDDQKWRHDGKAQRSNEIDRQKRRNTWARDRCVFDANLKRSFRSVEKQ